MLDKLIAENYGLTNVKIAPAPRGFVAETYYVDSDCGHYFAKLVKPSFDALTIAPSLPVLRELRQLGIEEITYPIPMQDGQLSLPLNGGLFVLFNHVPGQWVFDFPLEPYVRLLADIHRLSNRIQTPLARETYELGLIPDLLAFCERLWTETFTHPQEKALADWAIRRRDDLQRDIKIAQETIAQLQTTELPFILTHGDAPGNVLYDGKTVYLVDWDMVLFAPHERDIWFHRDNAEFLALYHQLVPEYVFNPAAYRFYLYKRYLEDVIGFFDKILSPVSTDAEKARNFDELIKD
jgi:Ser/Thr protein kinase RdoA (MazF antagonist)